MAMSTLAHTDRLVTIGVDTHADVHVAAALDDRGRQLDTLEFDATAAGSEGLLVWAASFGPLVEFGVEGTGSYGKDLTRALIAAGHVVQEVIRPNRQQRRRNGKSDRADAAAAARTVQAGEAAGVAKAPDGTVEDLRVLRVAREGAVKARTQAINAFKSLLVTGPADLRASTRHRSVKKMVAGAAGWDLNHGTSNTATHVALRSIALRIQQLDREVAELTRQRDQLVESTAPEMLARHGVGPHSATNLLIAAGDNPHRLVSEAAFAMLCGAAPVEASSGKTRRFRLNRGGDRQANAALYRIAIVRMKSDPRTRHYVDRRTKEGKTTKEIIRCLKRAIARELFPLMVATTTAQKAA
jgi:transposase